VDLGEAEDVDMILMATQGRGGLERLWMGSVTERVVQLTQRPVFLLPIHSIPAPEYQASISKQPAATPEIL
jgi:hypothetical protein